MIFNFESSNFGEKSSFVLESLLRRRYNGDLIILVSKSRLLPRYKIWRKVDIFSDEEGFS
jgi:hypothetical protein